jgi:CheY-like chemotaxis protein/energy-coupling factor transporter ATP-binding protein EcfA2
MKLPENTGLVLVRRVKVVARLDVTNSMRPQDGRMALRVDGQMVDLRVSTLPVARRGEKIVVRILDKRHLKLDLGTLGLAESEQRLLQRLLSHREGLLLVTGPTGSGKTTTLYAALNQLRTGKVNITTVEDPVEYDIPDIAQIQVNEAQGLTFASALRSVLRQDPDVVLVGEIRDRETAEIAVQASMTGHLVLSTLHTNDAPSAAVRMRDMGVDGFKLGSTLIGVVAQRLIRKLCDKCAVPLAASALPVEARPPAGQACAARRAVGCEACGGTGYRGRLPIVEVLVVDQVVGRQIEQGESPIAIASVARRNGTRTLWESGLERIWRGLTDLTELQRVVGEQAEVAPDVEAAVPDAGERAALIAEPTDAGETSDPVKPAPAKKPRARKPKKAAEPIAPAPPPVVAVAPAPDAAARVLVVDDDPQMRRFVRMVLEREQHAVFEAGDGLEALEAAERDRPDLVVMDLDMPRLDGMATLEELRDRPATAALPVILLTARTEDEGEALDRGASDFLAKPLQPKALAARVRAVLRRARV